MEKGVEGADFKVTVFEKQRTITLKKMEDFISIQIIAVLVILGVFDESRYHCSNL